MTASGTCRRCGLRRATQFNVLGEGVCGSCHERQTGMAVGVASGGGLPGAVAGIGVLGWIRRAMGLARD